LTAVIGRQEHHQPGHDVIGCRSLASARAFSHSGQESMMRPRRLRTVVLPLLAVLTGPVWAHGQPHGHGPGLSPGHHNAITDVPGISVGHFTAEDAGTTVVLAAGTTGQGVAGGITQRGGSPGTRETDLMRPDNMVETMNAIVLSGGSAYGLAAASGVMRCLEDRGVGFPVGGGNVVPIVPSAVSFDRASCGRPAASRPDFTAGLQACLAATGGAVEQGNVGAGTGAVSGGIKGGIGSASVVLPNGVVVGALVSVNSEGAAYDGDGDLLAASLELGNEFRTLTQAGGHRHRVPPSLPGGPLRSGTNAVVATNVQLTKSQATKIAEMADDGVARAISPAHTAGDGDTLFVLGTARLAIAELGDPNEVITQIGTVAAHAVSRAIVHALLSAKSTSCQPSYCDTFRSACRNRR
jgi:L-aminopeptidase/D-esterase-like protein